MRHVGPPPHGVVARDAGAVRIYLVIRMVFGISSRPLMVVHEFGHYLAARAFKMRVSASRSFRPGHFQHTRRAARRPQLAIIPFLAYVQIADEPDRGDRPEDQGSYANASLIGRITTIVRGPSPTICLPPSSLWGPS